MHRPEKALSTVALTLSHYRATLPLGAAIHGLENAVKEGDLKSAAIYEDLIRQIEDTDRKYTRLLAYIDDNTAV